MMKVHNLRNLCRENGGEYVLGLKDLKTHACYMIYGELKPGEESRIACPGRGHEEILLAAVGDLDVEGDSFNGTLKEGQAVHMKEEQTCKLANRGKSKIVYIMAGGHSGVNH